MIKLEPIVHSHSSKSLLKVPDKNGPVLVPVELIESLFVQFEILLVDPLIIGLKSDHTQHTVTAYRCHGYQAP